MKLKELIEKFEERKTIIGNYQGYAVWWKDVKEIFEQLDEPQPVKVPQFVADWIEYCKVKKITLAHALYRSEEAENKNVFSWIVKDSDNQETFARAWLDGYEVEEEKRYIVSLKNGQPLVKSQSGNTLYFNQNITAGNYKFTRKELEEADFSWVFDCPGIEIEEVE